MAISSTELDHFLENLSPLDQHFGRLLEKLSGQPNPEVRLAAALASYFTTEHGHICINLDNAREFFHDDESFQFPKIGEWLSALRASAVVGTPGEFHPLILDTNGRLYLHRYWTYEQKLARHIRSRLGARTFDLERLRAGLKNLFPDTSELDWQKIGAVTAVTKGFSVISGGPGTGKTTTVLKILVLLLEQSFPTPLRIALAAPTGKAAAGLADSIQTGKERLACPAEIKSLLPTHASTIHRLLGHKGGSSAFEHNRQNPLPVDVLVVDEASMVDLALMSKLLEALPATARVILLGDKDQLSSVEPGAVFGDICEAADNQFSQQFHELCNQLGVAAPPRRNDGKASRDNIVILQRSFRFNEEIGDVSRLIQHGDSSGLLKRLRNPSAAIALSDLPPKNELSKHLRELVMTFWRKYLEAEDPLERLAQFKQFRILCATRHGPFGVLKMNRQVELLLSQERLIKTGTAWYEGRPVMITQNDYNLNLFNGDIGIVGFDRDQKTTCVYIGGEKTDLRKLSPLQLPQHETAFAMSVHKSQGSEFERVLLVLPEVEGSLLSRELIYTAFTRAREGVRIWANQDTFRKAITRRTQRFSGLSEQLLPDIRELL